jgi:hypothetical protein
MNHPTHVRQIGQRSNQCDEVPRRRAARSMAKVPNSIICGDTTAFVNAKTMIGSEMSVTLLRERSFVYGIAANTQLEVTLTCRRAIDSDDSTRSGAYKCCGCKRNKCSLLSVLPGDAQSKRVTATINFRPITTEYLNANA